MHRLFRSQVMMSFASYLRRFRIMSGSERLLLAEATIVLTAASAAIRVLPFRRVVRAIAASPGDKHMADAEASKEAILRTRWAIEACARVLPWRIVCFQKGLAMQWMLQRRHVPTRLHYGVRQDQQKGLSAHVWVTHQGEPIIGGEEADKHSCLATFPASEAVEEEKGGVGPARPRTNDAKC